METANKLRSEDPSISFDICVIKILHEFFLEVNFLLFSTNPVNCVWREPKKQSRS